MLPYKFKDSFPLYADDCQINVPKPKWSDHTIKTITDCLADIRLWMSAKFLSFNESMTVIVVSATLLVLRILVLTSSLSSHLSSPSVVTNLGVRLDSTLKLDLQKNKK